MYELRYDSIIEAAWDLLPPSARDEFDKTLLRVCADPCATTVPYGIDDGMTRHLVLSHTMAVLLVKHSPEKTVRIIQITHLETR
ncbi:hypothetical protein [Streptomyces clavuligerus]|uniref:hypothetical protein n=1 Tax=Streptomyces clavuligerus TaxID=1901 RepID=UPI0001851F70|nr:hypothetical protein [Streptomyces clavuligerus]WDN56059.1 hypothetical protein LL058_29725 [Streptomyces clavuligerus]